MTSTETIHETIAKLRQRLSEIDALIERMEHERTSVHIVMKTEPSQPRQRCRRSRALPQSSSVHFDEHTSGIQPFASVCRLK